MSTSQTTSHTATSQELPNPCDILRAERALAERALADAKALREQAETLTSEARLAMRDAVIGAAEAGMGNRAISRHAGVSHTAVANILQETA